MYVCRALSRGSYGFAWSACVYDGNEDGRMDPIMQDVVIKLADRNPTSKRQLLVATKSRRFVFDRLLNSLLHASHRLFKSRVNPNIGFSSYIRYLYFRLI